MQDLKCIESNKHSYNVMNLLIVKYSMQSYVLLLVYLMET